MPDYQKQFLKERVGIRESGLYRPNQSAGQIKKINLRPKTTCKINYIYDTLFPSFIVTPFSIEEILSLDTLLYLTIIRRRLS